MNCLRSEELLSDHVGDALAPPLESELREHLASCRECSELLEALREVLEILGGLEVPAPPEELTDKILARTLSGARPGEGPPLRPSRVAWFSPGGWPAAASWLAAAAVFVFVLVWRPPELFSEWSRSASKMAHQVYSFGVRTANDAERWIVELNVLRMTVGVAFEDRLDELNERLRALDEARRRASEQEGEPSSSREHFREPLAIGFPPHTRSSA